MADAGDRHNADDVPDDDEMLEPWQRVMRENARKAKVERFVELLRVRVDPDLSIARRRQISSSSALLSKYLSLIASSFSHLLPSVDHVARSQGILGPDELTNLAALVRDMDAKHRQKVAMRRWSEEERARELEDAAAPGVVAPPRPPPSFGIPGMHAPGVVPPPRPPPS